MNEISFPYKTKVLKVSQRLGSFYVAALPSELLLRVAASDRVRAVMNSDGISYTLEGTQRVIQDKRLNEIAEYINRFDSSFPNSIILSANYDLETGLDQEESEYMKGEAEEASPQPSKISSAWTVKESGDDCHELTIPTPEQIAAIIDGQHRLFSFTRADVKAMKDTNLLCSIYIDLPKALQAQIFATINSTQKRVDRSLTYELFGYNVVEEDEKYWSTDKLAVYLTRKLGTDPKSPLRGRIVVAPKRDAALDELASSADWRVSTAVVVDGILRLFSTNPKRDSNILRGDKAIPRDQLLLGPKDRSPLRELYIANNDLAIYKIVLNYLNACKEVFWKAPVQNNYIYKTIGVQAIFDVLRKLSYYSAQDKKIRKYYFEGILKDAEGIDFSEGRFRNLSGSGRTYIRQTIEQAIANGIENRNNLQPPSSDDDE